MKLKFLIFLSITVIASTFFSACSSGAGKTSKDAVADSNAGGTKDEVVITNADFKTDRPVVSTTQEGKQLPKRVLDDSSEVDIIVDGFGNKIETRNFPETARLRMVVMRTTPKGQQQVTVYSRSGESKIVTGLGERALTASDDEIAAAAQFSSTEYSGPAKNFLKKGSSESQTPLRALPSSEFQKTQTPVYPATEPSSTETKVSEEKPVTQPGSPDED